MHSPPATVDLDALDHALATLADRTAVEGPWRSGAFAALARSGMLAAFVPRDAGGTGATEADLVGPLVAIAERCLTTALAVTQWAAAVRIIAGGTPSVRDGCLPPLARGEAFTTVGISHLTTSRRHLATPAVTAVRTGDTWRLDGLCPWVTGADACDTIVTGAATTDAGQMFFVVPTAAAGVTIDPPMAMLALSGSRTSAVRLAGVTATHAIAAPTAAAARTGGLSTSALAIGAARASTAVIAREAEARPALAPIATGLEREVEGLTARLAVAARDGVETGERDRLRADANGLVVRAAQAALTASKGAGFVAGHPAERLVRESLFFLVWSCPQAVTEAFLCELSS